MGSPRVLRCRLNKFATVREEDEWGSDGGGIKEGGVMRRGGMALGGVHMSTGLVQYADECLGS